MVSARSPGLGKSSFVRGLIHYLQYALILLGVVAAYFAVAKLGLALASIHPSATPIWPPTGLALAAVLLGGPRVWPAIFAGALLVNLTTAGTLATSAAIAAGNTLEAVVNGYLIERWSGGRATFDAPTGIAKFALICMAPGTAISATVGVGALSLAGYAEWANFAPIWLTWWLGDTAGALVVTPVLVSPAASRRGSLLAAAGEAAALYAAACAIGVLAFSPLIEQTGDRTPLAFLAILPLLWAALRRGQRDTATVALILSGFAVWGTVWGGGPFSGHTQNESFLLLLTFIISCSVPSLALSAEVEARRQTEASLLRTRDELEERIDERTAALREANRALREAEQRARLLIEGVRDHAIFMLDPAGHVVSWNAGAARITQYGAAEIIGRHFGDFYTPEDRARGEPEQALRVAAQEGKCEAEAWRLRKDGSRFWASVVIEAIRDDSGALVGFAKITRDGTERKQAQAALDEARETLAQSQKMEALGQLTGGIAHDFNNLLMIVSGHAEILRRRLSEPKVLHALDAIRSAASRGEGLTRQLLAFARAKPLSPVVVDLGERIEAVRAMLGSSLRGNIELDCDIPNWIWPVEVDSGELELALVNIAVNARDAMPNGGKIALSAQNVTLAPDREPGGLAGDFVALAMTDTGEGIPPDVLPKIFDPFFTTKAVGKGTGLGLSQVYGFAHQSGGGVAAKSEAGRGTVITMYLPRSHAAATVDNGGGGEGTILVVEDNAEVADVTSGLLDQLGYRVLRAESAAAALDSLHNGAQVDLVLSDIVMPGALDGIGLADEVRRLYPEIPVLLTSGFSDAIQAAGSHYAILRKPFQMSALEKAIREAFRSRAGSGEAAAPH